MRKPPFKRNPYLRDKFWLTDFLLNRGFTVIRNLKDSKQVNDQARDEALTNWIKETWEAQGGMDEVKLAEYDFYLSWPNASAPNKVRKIFHYQEVMILWSFMSHDLGPLD